MLPVPLWGRAVESWLQAPSFCWVPLINRNIRNKGLCGREKEETQELCIPHVRSQISGTSAETPFWGEWAGNLEGMSQHHWLSPSLTQCPWSCWHLLFGGFFKSKMTPTSHWPTWMGTDVGEMNHGEWALSLVLGTCFTMPGSDERLASLILGFLLELATPTPDSLVLFLPALLNHWYHVCNPLSSPASLPSCFLLHILNSFPI